MMIQIRAQNHYPPTTAHSVLVNKKKTVTHVTDERQRDTSVVKVQATNSHPSENYLVHSTLGHGLIGTVKLVHEKNNNTAYAKKVINRRNGK